MFLLQRRSAVVLLIAVTIALVRVDAATVSPQSAESFAVKIASIRDHEEQGRAGSQRTPTH